jgi:hypothetical protein
VERLGDDLSAGRPRAFDTVGRDAHALGIVQAVLPVRTWDWFMNRYLGV